MLLGKKHRRALVSKTSCEALKKKKSNIQELDDVFERQSDRLKLLFLKWLFSK